jgi:hypothetical protein
MFMYVLRASFLRLLVRFYRLELGTVPTVCYFYSLQSTTEKT